MQLGVVVSKCSKRESPKPLPHPSLKRACHRCCFPSIFFLVQREVGDSSAVVPDTAYSYCNDDSFATGATVWASVNYVYGIVLECAELTATCAPPNVPASLLDSGMSSENVTPDVNATPSNNRSHYSRDKRDLGSVPLSRDSVHCRMYRVWSVGLCARILIVCAVRWQARWGRELKIRGKGNPSFRCKAQTSARTVM